MRYNYKDLIACGMTANLWFSAWFGVGYRVVRNRGRHQEAHLPPRFLNTPAHEWWQNDSKNCDYLRLFCVYRLISYILQAYLSNNAKKRPSFRISAYFCKFYFIASATATATATVAPTMVLLPKKFRVSYYRSSCYIVSHCTTSANTIRHLYQSIA